MLLTDFPVPNVGIHHKEDNTQAYIDGNLSGTGSLYIAESQVTWMSAGGEGGFCLEYPKICLHAISRDLTAFPHECLYLQVEGKLIEEDRQSNSSSEDDPDDTPTSEVRFVPADKGALDALFSALSQCQILHPDPEEPDYDEENGVDQIYEGEEGVEALTEEGQVNLQRFENMLRQGQGDGAASQNTNGNSEEAMEGGDNEGQFDDADMEH